MLFTDYYLIIKKRGGHLKALKEKHLPVTSGVLFTCRVLFVVQVYEGNDMKMRPCGFSSSYHCPRGAFKLRPDLLSAKRSVTSLITNKTQHVN